MATKLFERIYDLPTDIGITNFGFISLLKGADGMIYGNAGTGGTGHGIIFKLAMDGTGFQVLRTFSSAEKNEWLPMRLVYGADAKLYGITALGGESDAGVIFRMNADGTEYKRIFELPEEQELRLPAEVDLTLFPKIPQHITFFLPSNNAKVGDAAITLQATSDAGLPVTFSSSNPDIAKIEGSTLTIIGVGEVTITAAQTANDFYTRSAVTQTLSISKGEQLVAISPFPDITIEDDQIDLPATSSAGLPIVYSTTDDNISLTANKVKILAAGRATITAEQPGDENYNAAETVQYTFCVDPVKPVISEERFHPTELLLTSSNDTGNQWYFNGQLIEGATAKTLVATEDGTYTVKTTVEDCVSELSDELLTIVTDVEMPSRDNISIYPNPVTKDVAIDFNYAPQDQTTISISDYSGKPVITQTSITGREVFDLGSLSKGLYLIEIKTDGKILFKRIMKK
jgi:hypothetical protein